MKCFDIKKLTEIKTDGHTITAICAGIEMKYVLQVNVSTMQVEIVVIAEGYTVHQESNIEKITTFWIAAQDNDFKERDRASRRRRNVIRATIF